MLADWAGRAPWPGHDLVEGAADEAGLAPPGHFLPGRARSAGDRDLLGNPGRHTPGCRYAGVRARIAPLAPDVHPGGIPRAGRLSRPYARSQIGRASCRERECTSV